VKIAQIQTNSNYGEAREEEEAGSTGRSRWWQKAATAGAGVWREDQAAAGVGAAGGGAEWSGGGE